MKFISPPSAKKANYHQQRNMTDRSLDEQLLEAIESCSLNRVRELLAAGANPNAKRGDRSAWQLTKYDANEIKCALIEAGAEDPSMLYLLDWAVYVGRVETVKILIDKGADINFGPFPPLQAAAMQDKAEIVDILMEAGADLDAGNSMGTPLISAIEEGNFQIAFKLIIAGADPNMTSERGDKTPIVSAAIQDSAEVIRALVKAGAEMDIVSGVVLPNTKRGLFARESTPAILAARCGNAEALAALLEAGADPDKKDGEGLSAYNWASRNRDLAVLDVLREAGVEGSRNSLDLELLSAAETGDTARIAELVAKGADVNARDRYQETKNYTPLMLAAAGGHLQSVTQLLAAGVNISVKSVLGEDALFLASDRGDIAVVRELLDAGADINTKNRYNETALMKAAQRCDIEMVELLLKRGVEVNAVSKIGEAALLLVAGARQWVAVKEDDPPVGMREYGSEGLRELRPMPEEQILAIADALLEAGADPNLSGCHTTALIEAASRGYLRVLLMLIDAGARVDLVTDDGKNILQMAELHRQDRVVEFLQPYANDIPVLEAIQPSAEELLLPTFDEFGGSDSDEDRWGPELEVPDFSAAADNPEYRQAVADLAELCGSTPIPFVDSSAAFQFHINTKRRAGIDTESLQRSFLERGCFVYEIEYSFGWAPKKLAILPTTDKYEAIAFVQTDGANYDIGPGYIVEWLKQLEAEQPFVLTCICHDTLAGRFLTALEDPEALAQRMYEFCHDIVEQGCQSVEALAESLRSSDDLFFWWD